jgi:RTX calcium-binding nonapeptide repeat (4 copies)
MGIGDVVGEIGDAVPGGIGAGKRIVGGTGDDRIEGTGGSDEILADPVPEDDRGGDDEVWGLGGDDYVRAWGGDNFVDGGPGDDELITADGEDVMLGGPGGDEMQGGRGTDLLRGGRGDDEVRGSEGDDTLYGDAGDDRIIGSSGNDLVHGGMGVDQLEGREGVDRFAWSSAAEGRDAILDFELAVDGFVIGDFLQGFGGDVAGLGLDVRFAPTGDGRGSLLQVDPDGAGAGPWRDLAVVAGQPRLNATALYQVGDLVLDGHAADTPFGPLAYIASHDDLIAAFGADQSAGKRHYLESGYDEGRATTFDGLQYIAGQADLILALGPEPTDGAEHFIRSGREEGRQRDGFDEVQYLANYADLQAAFGNDLAAATRHFITTGYLEERTDQPLGAAADFIV